MFDLTTYVKKWRIRQLKTVFSTLDTLCVFASDRVFITAICTILDAIANLITTQAHGSILTLIEAIHLTADDCIRPIWLVSVIVRLAECRRRVFRPIYLDMLLCHHRAFHSSQENLGRAYSPLLCNNYTGNMCQIHQSHHCSQYQHYNGKSY